MPSNDARAACFANFACVSYFQSRSLVRCLVFKFAVLPTSAIFNHVAWSVVWF